jgi:hypothetical protein
MLLITRGIKANPSSASCHASNVSWPFLTHMGGPELSTDIIFYLCTPVVPLYTKIHG